MRKGSLSLIGLGLWVFILLTAAEGIADPLDTWHWRNPLPQGNNLWGLGYGNGLLTAVGEYGTLLTSTDGIEWTPKSTGAEIDLTGIAFGNGLHVVIGRKGTILTSSDTVSWTRRESGTTLSLNGIAYGQDKFVISADSYMTGDYAILTSVDGEHWIPRVKATGHRLGDIVYGNGRFVALGGGMVLLSSDGETWTTPLASPALSLNTIAYGNGLFLVADGDRILSSPDGEVWTEEAKGFSLSLTGMAFGNGVFVAIDSAGGVMTSSEGRTWAKQTDQPGVLRVGFGKGLFVLAGTHGLLLTSPDGSAWIVRSSGSPEALRAIVSGSGRFVAAGDETILTSSDGAHWAKVMEEGARGLAYGNGKFVGVRHNRVLLSDDGTAWTTVEVPEDLLRIAYGNGKFVAIGYQGNVLTSYGGLSWTVGPPVTSDFISGIAFGGGLFVVVGEWGQVFVSLHGVSWVRKYLDVSAGGLGQVAYGGGVFVATAGYGRIVTSRDGERWETLKLPSGVLLDAVSWGGGVFVTTGVDDRDSNNPVAVVFTSPDGITWLPRPAVTAKRIQGMAWGNGTFVMAGDEGVLLQSDPVGKLPQISLSPNSVDLGDAKAGMESQPGTLIVGNWGNADLHVGAVTLQGQEVRRFRVTDDRCSGMVVVPGDACSVTLVFAPTEKGERYAVLSIPTDDEDTPVLNVPVRGKGYSSLLVVPDEGASGTEIVLSGMDFGVKPGKAYLGSTRLTVSAWQPDRVTAVVTKSISQGAYDVVVARGKEMRVTEPSGFRIKPPTLDALPPWAVGGAELDLTGAFWGKGKLKITVGGKNCAVLDRTVDPETEASRATCRAPRLPSGLYRVTVTNSAGSVVSGGGLSLLNPREQ